MRDHNRLLENLTDALGNSNGQSIEEVKAELKDEGIDVDAAVTRLKDARLNISMMAKEHDELELMRAANGALCRVINSLNLEVQSRDALLAKKDEEIGLLRNQVIERRMVIHDP